jgi:WD40 repeat protein
MRREFNVVDQVGKKGDVRMYTVCYAPTGGLVATAHLDGVVRIWDAADMMLRKQFEVKGRFVYGSIAFSPDGLWLATGSMAGDITLWDPLTGKEVWDVGRHQHYVDTVGFGRDNRSLVTGGSDGVCYLWDLQPRGEGPGKEMNGLWDDLTGDEGPAAYRAMWAMATTPDQTVKFLGDKLRPVTTVIDTNRLGKGLSTDEVERRARLSRLLAKQNEKVELLMTVRRAVSLLVGLGTPSADRLLGELAGRNPRSELESLAADAIRSGGSTE